MAQMWYIETGGRPEGPLTSKELRDRAASGRLRPTDRVSPDGTKWAPAAKIKGLVFVDTVEQRPNATVEVSVSASGSVRPVAVAPPPAPSVKPAASPPQRQLPGSQAAVETSEGKLDRIPGYEIAGVLGKGACGVVYRARQVKLDRTVALKMVLSDRRPSQAALARFEKEAVSLAKLRHPNIVGVYDCGHHDGQAFFAMELLEGEDLGARLDRTGRLDEFTAWHIARQTAAALAHAAELGVYHRDIKPANLFLTPPPTGYPLPPGVPLVKVTDFGLALTRQTDDATDQRLTAAGVVLGTPAYMPPEQFAGSDIDHRADIYALGATVYHLLAGDAPFDGATVWEVMINKSGPTPRLGAAVSQETDDLVAAMMAPKPGDRIGNYRELLDRIDTLALMQGTAGSLPSVRMPALSPSRISKAVPLPPDPDDEEPAEGGDEYDDAPRSRRFAKPRPKSKAKLYALAVLGGLGIAAAVAIGAKFLGGKPDEANKPPAKAGVFATGDREELFNRETLLGWSGKGWSIAKDEEGTAVLAGKGSAVRPFKSSKDYRVVLGIDPHEASVVEVVVATAEGPPATAKQWLVRIDRQKGAVFGVREGETGAFQPLGASVPVPTKAEVDAGEKGKYSEVRYERAGGRVRAYFLGKPLGEIEYTGLTRATEIRLTAEGGTVHIDTAAAEELIEK
ncbi:protein kinase domain-containing protein [Gemmata sp.]|uniref:protein kinase domain-containing protein n=1 Tax=Gemmata sp. TaxID=1914242 RepID=UPI003F6FA848